MNKKTEKLKNNFSCLLFFLTLFLLPSCAQRKVVIDLPVTASADTSTHLITSSPHVARLQQHAQASQQQTVQPQESSADTHLITQTVQERFAQVEAQWSSTIFIPLGFTPIVCTQQDQQMVIEGELVCGLADIVLVCQQEMERLGWVQTVMHTQEPVLMVYTKPDQSCSYRMVQQKKSWFTQKQVVQITIWLGYRG